MAEEQNKVVPPNGAPADGAEPEKKKRGKPKDLMAPPKPKGPYAKFCATARDRLKAENPSLITDLSAMGKALAEAWGAVPEEDKKASQEVYDKEMKIWKPKWDTYKQTDHFREFVEIKTDWLDIRAKKKLQKTMTKDAPKRAKSGYMIHAGEVREAVMEEVKAKGLGMGDGGRLIAERWNALNEVQKAKYGDISVQQKKVFDVEWAKYLSTDSYSLFRDAKANLEAKQGLKKITRTTLGPKKAASAYALFRAEVMPGVVDENEKLETKLACGDIAKKVAGMWQAVPDDKKKPYLEKAEKLRQEYLDKVVDFKCSKPYRMFLDNRKKIKERQNKELRLRNLPKRPKSVFAMFCDDHKTEVPPGKGEGKGRNALQTLFAKTDADKKAEYEKKEKEMKEKWANDVAEFKASQTYKTYEDTISKVLKEYENEAVKMTTLKFIRLAPKVPPKTAFAQFLHEKRKAEGTDENEPKSKQQKAQEVTTAKAEWGKVPGDLKKQYEVRMKDGMKGYAETCKQYMESPQWKEYVAEAKQMRIPVKSLLFHKKKVIKKLKKGEKMPPSMILLPDRPDNWPEKPVTAIQFFFAEKKEAGGSSLEEIQKQWTGQDDEERKVWNDKAMADINRFREETTEFKQSDEGKKFFRDLNIAKRRRILLAAKNKYLDDLPKKPLGAIQSFMTEKLNDVRRNNKGKKGFEIKKILQDMWSGMDEEARAKLETDGKDRMVQFQEAMTAFKDSDNWRKFQMACKSGQRKEIPKPDNFPKKPPGAFQMFVKARGGKAGELGPVWKELDAEKKQEYNQQAKEAEVQFTEEMKEFNNSDVGKRFYAAKKRAIMTKAMSDAKSKFLKNQPKKPATAFTIFVSEKRPEVQAANPDIKGLGPMQTKLSELWKALTPEEKEVWTEKEKEKMAEFRQQTEEFHASDDYKKYQLVVRRFAAKPAKKKGAGKGAPVQAGPKPPEGFPAKPATAINLYGKKLKEDGKGGGLKELMKAWGELGKDGQKDYNEQARDLQQQYVKDLEEFRKSADGKRYFREKEAFEKRNKLKAAKDRLIGSVKNADGEVLQEPKRPPSAYFVFVGEKRSTITGGLGEVAKELTKMWNALEAEEKKKYEDKSKELKEKYDEDMATYRNSAAYKQYARVVDGIQGKKAKAAKTKVVAAKAKAKGAAAPKAKGRGKGAAPAAADSDSDVMGSDSGSDSSKSSDSDSD